MEEEVIINQIIDEAKNEANLMLLEATEKAKKIQEETSQKMANQSQDQFEITKRQIERDITSSLEKAEFEARSKELIERKRLIEIVKEKVKQKIRDLDEKTYISIIDEKISKYKNQQNVELILPKKSYEAIKKMATEYGMRVLEVTENFDTGVIVKCGNIEYNYDFEENMKFKDEEIEKEIDTILFN